MSKLHFFGGAGSVTGANFGLDIETPEGVLKVLVDCGLTQGVGSEKKNAEEFAYDPQAYTWAIITHAHIDHIGRLPLLVKRGFSGRIVSTPATKDLARVMLKDALSVMRQEAKYDDGVEVLYGEEDIGNVLNHWDTYEYGEEIPLAGDVRVIFKNAGHILGSAMPLITTSRGSILFTGDVGNPGTPLLPLRDTTGDVDYVLTESVYGDRVHEDVKGREGVVEALIHKVAKSGGALLIPAFSMERTQILLSEINDLVETGKVPALPVFLDSPLAIEVTEVYARYSHLFNEEMRKKISAGDDIFDFPGLVMTESKEASQEIWNVEGAKIIIAGSGMSHAGRIIYHEMHYLEDPNTIVLFVGYQAPGSPGRLIMDGARSVRLHKKDIKVKAEIRSVLGYSAHADSEELLRLVSETEHVKKVFVAMGEPRSSTHLAKRIRDYLGKDAVVPTEGQSFEIDI